MNKTIVAMFAAFAMVFASACGGSTAAPKKVSQESGSVSAALTLAGGETLSNVTYLLSDGANTYSGNGDVTTGSFVISDIAPGSGYTLGLSGTTDDGFSNCSGLSAPFLVQTQLTTPVAVTLTCALINPPDGGGSVDVFVSTTNCPSVNPLVADQTTVGVGASTNVAASAGGPDVPSLTYTWVVLSPGTGFLGTPSANGTTTSEVTFYCPANAESDTVQVSVTDGDNCTLTEELVITCQ